KDKVSVDNIHQAIGDRSFGPFLMIPGLIAVSPVGGVPGLPTTLAAISILFSVQILLGRNHFWIPAFLGRRTVKGERLADAAASLHPLARWSDRLFHGRLTWLTNAPFDRMIAAVCILLALTVTPLEVVPFASAAPMGTIAMFGLALLVKDGLLVLIGMVLSLVSVYVLFTNVIP